jgi:hypothetical protein
MSIPDLTPDTPDTPDPLAVAVEEAFAGTLFPTPSDRSTARLLIVLVAHGHHEKAEVVCRGHANPARLALAMAHLVVGMAGWQQGDEHR